MNMFESTLSSALRDEAQEIAMTADLNEGREILDNRLDDVDRGRRRGLVIAGVAAAAAVAAITFFAVGRPAAAPQPADPTPSPTSSMTFSSAFSSSEFAFPFTATTPTWVNEFMDAPTSENMRHVTWNRCTDDICVGLTFLSLSVLDPFGVGERDETAMPGYRGYLDYLDSLVASGRATIAERSSVTVGDRPATVLTVTPLSDVPDGVGCEAGDGVPDDCWDFVEGLATRMAVVDVGSSNPLVILTRTPPSNVDGAAWIAQFDPMLDSVEFDLSRVNPMLGVWQTSFTGEQVTQVLAAAELEESTEQVLAAIGDVGDLMRWELWIDPTWYRLYSVGSDGSRVLVDQHTYERGDDLVTGTTTEGKSLATVSTVTVDGKDLRWTVESAENDPTPGVLSEESMARALYTTSTWVRSTT